MCTILVLHRVHPAYPVVIAANRDEAYARDTAPPRVLRTEPRIVGGLDREAGGTWLGLTPGGMCASITNQRSWFPPEPASRSRGAVVMDVLEAASRAPPNERRAAWRAHLERLDPRAQNSFNLVVADASGVDVVYARRDAATVEIVGVPAGIHVLANDRLGSPAFPKLARARALLDSNESIAGASWEALKAQVARALADHAVPALEDVKPPPPGARFSREVARALQAICIHTPSYGTRSATIAALHPEGVGHYLHADGPPCQTAFSDRSHLLARGAGGASVLDPPR